MVELLFPRTLSEDMRDGLVCLVSVKRQKNVTFRNRSCIYNTGNLTRCQPLLGRDRPDHLLV